MRKNIIDENFVDELCKSGVWDIARVDLGSVNESAEVEDTDEISARELAEELFENLSDDIIYECIDILHGSLLNEEDDLDEENQLLEDIFQEMDEEDFDYLIDEAIAALEEDYDLSEATEEDLNAAIIDEISDAYIRRAGAADMLRARQAAQAGKSGLERHVRVAGTEGIKRKKDKHSSTARLKTNRKGEFSKDAGTYGRSRTEAPEFDPPETPREGDKLDYYHSRPDRKAQAHMKKHDAYRRDRVADLVKKNRARKEKAGTLNKETALRKERERSGTDSSMKTKKANESTINEEENYQLLEDIIQDMNDTELDAHIAEAIAVLEEDYDLSEATQEEVTEAVLNEFARTIGRIGAAVTGPLGRIKQGFSQQRTRQKTDLRRGKERFKQSQARGERAHKRNLASGDIRDVGRDVGGSWLGRVTKGRLGDPGESGLKKIRKRVVQKLKDKKTGQVTGDSNVAQARAKKAEDSVKGVHS